MLSSYFGLFVGLLVHVVLARGQTTYNWDVTWVKACPDGVCRPAIGINGKWPCPRIEVPIGERVIIHVNNKLGNETTAIHFHGLFQTGTNGMDGPAGVTQCPIPVGGSFTYDFTVCLTHT